MDAIIPAVKSLWEQIPTVVTQLPTIELIYAILFLPVLVAAFSDILLRSPAGQRCGHRDT
jgi:hypothetical protein